MDTLEDIRELLKKQGINMTEDELQTTVTEFQYLIDVWLNDIERNLFQGKTLDELLIDKNI
jgi:hypothetical protein